MLISILDTALVEYIKVEYPFKDISMKNLLILQSLFSEKYIYIYIYDGYWWVGEDLISYQKIYL